MDREGASGDEQSCEGLPFPYLFFLFYSKSVIPRKNEISVYGLMLFAADYLLIFSRM